MARATARFRLGTLIPWLVLGLAGAALLAAMRYGPLRNPPPSLQLMVHDPRVGLGATARLDPPAWADTSAPGAIRMPLLIAIRNTGRRDVVATDIRLSAPWQIRIEAVDGSVLPMMAEGGNPLLHYRIPLEGGVPARGGAFGVVVPGHERLWVRPVAPSLACTLDGAGVPEFSPAAPLDAAILARPVIYWTIQESDPRRRSSGVITLELDPHWFDVPPAPAPPDFPPLSVEDTTRLPDLSTMRPAGQRSTLCGEAIEPVTLASTVYRTPGNGRILALAVDGRTRKLLFDLDGDSVIEAEAWGSTGSRIEFMRRTRFAIPDFLLPLPPPPTLQPAIDTAGVEDTVRDTVVGGVAEDTVRRPPPDTARRDTTGARSDTLTPRPPPRDTTGPDPSRPDGSTDSAWRS